MYNPYQYNPYQYQQVLPQQQIIQVNGKASVDTIQLAPNSSVLVMDTSAPIVWMCVSDGVGKVTSTPYDIVVHVEEPPVDVKSLEERLSTLEKMVRGMTNESNATESNTKQNRSKPATS